MIYRLIIIGLLLGGCSKMEIATDALLVADWSQTRQLPDIEGVHEKLNLVLPENPTKDEVDLYFGAVLAVNTLLHREWYSFPKANYYRKKLLPYYQGGLIGIEIKCIAGNESINVHVKFKK